MSQGLPLDAIKPGWTGYARAGYGTAFHSVTRIGIELATKCGKSISLARKPLTLIDHPPYAYAVCRKCDGLAFVFRDR